MHTGLPQDHKAGFLKIVQSTHCHLLKFCSLPGWHEVLKDSSKTQSNFWTKVVSQKSETEGQPQIYLIYVNSSGTSFLTVKIMVLILLAQL